MVDFDGVVRPVPLLAEYKDSTTRRSRWRWSELISATAEGRSGVSARAEFVGRKYRGLDGVRLKVGDKRARFPLVETGTPLVPFRGPGGPKGGSSTMSPRADVMAKSLPQEA